MILTYKEYLGRLYLSEVKERVGDALTILLPTSLEGSLRIGKYVKTLEMGAARVNLSKIPDGNYTPTLTYRGGEAALTPIRISKGTVRAAERTLTDLVREECELLNLTEGIHTLEGRIRRLERAVGESVIF